MSPARMRRLYREVRHLCAGCKQQPARFQYRGRVRADRDHNLCFRCYRAEVDRLRARRLTGVAGFRRTLPNGTGTYVPLNSTGNSDRVRNARTSEIFLH